VGHISVLSLQFYAPHWDEREKDIMCVWVCDGGLFQPYPPGRCLDEEKSLVLMCWVVGLMCALIWELRLGRSVKLRPLGACEVDLRLSGPWG
jgi:hypothetical protein